MDYPYVDKKILVSKANWYPPPFDGGTVLHSGTVCFTKHILYILVLLGYGLGIPGRECVNNLWVLGRSWRATASCNLVHIV
jgi:hypothetical protein